MRQRSAGPEQAVHLGTEYARSIARLHPRAPKSPSWSSYLSHPLAPAIALGVIAAGAFMLWPRPANGDWRNERDGDVDYADFPPRERSIRRGDRSREVSRSYID